MREINSENKLLMIMGVVEIEEDIRALASKPMSYNRTPDFVPFLKKIFEGLQYVFQTKEPVYLLSGSGTCMMEGAVTNTLSSNDEVLVVNGGTFGQRWADICKKHGIIVHEIKLEYGISVNPDQIKYALDKNPNIKAVFTTQDETSTGTLTDIESIAKIVRNYSNTILVVDCVSSLLIEPLKFDDWGIDVAVSSGNKSIAVPPGVGFMVYSKKAMAMAEKSNLRSYNTDVFEYKKEWERVSTPYTPPLTILNQLDKRLDKIKAEGLENIQQRYSNLTAYLRKGIELLGLKQFTKTPANCVTGIIVPDNIDAYDVVTLMRNKYNIELAPSWPDLRKKMFRVGNFGAVGKEEIDLFLKCLKLTLEELKCQK